MWDVGISFDIMLLPLQDLRSIIPSLSLPVHKMGRNVLAIPEIARHQQNSPSLGFSFFPVSLLHSSKWWPLVTMVTQHRVTLLRNNDKWWQQGGRAGRGSD